MEERRDTVYDSGDILVVPKGFLGDFVLMSPVFRALKESAPDRRVLFLSSPGFASYAAQNRFIDEVICFDRGGKHRGIKGLLRFAKELRGRKIETAFSFHRSWRTGLLLFLSRIPRRISYSGALSSILYTECVNKKAECHEVLRNLSLVVQCMSAQWRERLLRAMNFQTSDIFMEVATVSDADVSESVRSLDVESGSYVVLAPGSAWETKQWSSYQFRRLAMELSDRGKRVIVLGAKNDQQTARIVTEGLGANVVNLCGATSLAELVYLIKNAEGLVCNDSLALHVASAVKTPTVAVFCATSPRFGFGPWNNRAVIVEKGDLFCKPCRRHGSKHCPNGTRMCSTLVSAKDVLQALDDVVMSGESVEVEERAV
jgi:heptosyltransferase-2